MDINEKDVKKLSLILLIILLLVLVFLLVRPVLAPVIGGLILAYAFMPFYKKINTYIHNKSLAASIVCLTIIVFIVLILWFLIPVMLRQVSELYLASQNVDMAQFLKSIIPTASDTFLFQATKVVNGAVGTIIQSSRNALLGFVLDIPSIAINLFILSFVFFFAMRDSEKLKAFAKGLSPLSESKEKIIIKHFKDMTDAIVYGQIIVGVVQGLLAGFGFWIFGVEHAALLTVLSILFSLIPFLGPFIVWIPVALYLFATKSSGLALGFLIYNVFVVSIADNVLRSYLVSRKTSLSPAIVIIGMLGGVYVFGIIGLVIGPLLLAYLITLLESLKDKSIYSLFA